MSALSKKGISAFLDYQTETDNSTNLRKSNADYFCQWEL